MQKHIQSYVDWCYLRRQKMEHIQKKELFLRELNKLLNLQNASKQELELYLLRKYRDCTPKTYNNYLSMLRMFYKYLEDEDLIEKNPAKKIPFMEVERKFQKVFTYEEVCRIIHTPRPARRSRKEWDMYSLMFALIAFTGIRRSEAIGILIKDIITDPQRPYIILRKTKNGDDRVVMLPVKFDKELMEYANTYSNTYLFESRTGGILMRSSVTKAFERRLKLVGLFERGVGLHALRRYFVTQLLAKGADVHKVARAVGHRKIDTTMLYYYHTFEDLWDTVKLNPLFKDYEEQVKKDL